MCFGFRALGLGPWALGIEPWALGLAFYALGIGLWSLGCVPWAFGSWALALVLNPSWALRFPRAGVGGAGIDAQAIA